MILNKKIWTRLYLGIFFLVIIGLLQSLCVKTKICSKTSISARNVSNIELLISTIANVSAMDPPVEISEKCFPPDLPPVDKINCSQHPGLSGDSIYFFAHVILVSSPDQISLFGSLLGFEPDKNSSSEELS